MKPAETGGRVLWRICCGVATTVFLIARVSHLVYMGSSTGKHIQLHFGDVLNVAVEISHFPVTYERQKRSVTILSHFSCSRSRTLALGNCTQQDCINEVLLYNAKT